LLITILLLGVFIPIITISAKRAHESDLPQTTAIQTYELTDFADFEQVVDHNNITSSNNVSFIKFDYYGDYPDDGIYEK